MASDHPESDWRVFRELRELALERFCKRVLAELEPLIGSNSVSYHERYVTAFRLLKARDRELAHAFDDPRRSRMVPQLCAIHALGLLHAEELKRFTPRLRETVEALSGFEEAPS